MGKVVSASNPWRTWLSTHEAGRVEVERAKGRGCLTRSVKLAQLVRYFSFSAECGDSLREIEEWSALGNRDIDGQTREGSGRAAGESASQSASWLELLVESGIVSVEKLAPLRQESEELTAIFVTILKRAKTSKFLIN